MYIFKKMFSNINFQTIRQKGVDCYNSIEHCIGSCFYGSLICCGRTIEFIHKDLIFMILGIIYSLFSVILFPFRYIYEFHYDKLLLGFIITLGSFGEIANSIAAIVLVTNGSVATKGQLVFFITAIICTFISIAKRSYIHAKSCTTRPHTTTIQKVFICIAHSLPFLLGMAYTFTLFILINRDTGAETVPIVRSIVFAVFSLIGLAMELNIIYTSYVQQNHNINYSVNTVVPLVKTDIELLVEKIITNSKESCSETCSICMVDEPSTNKVADIVEKYIELQCKHTFHSSCIVEWLRTGIAMNTIKRCPLCRETIDVVDLDIV